LLEARSAGAAAAAAGFRAPPYPTESRFGADPVPARRTRLDDHSVARDFRSVAGAHAGGHSRPGAVARKRDDVVQPVAQSAASGLQEAVVSIQRIPARYVR